MGSIDPVSAALTAVGTARNIATGRAAQNAARQQYAAQMAQLRRSQSIEERRRREQLRRAEATQRARAGAGGIGGAGGSTDALLNGMAVQSARDIAESRSLLDDQDRRMRASLAGTARRNLLDTSFDFARDMLGLFKRS